MIIPDVKSGKSAKTATSFLGRLLIGSLFVALCIFSVGDHFYHVWGDALTYHWQPQLDGQSFWVYPLFFAASAAFLLLTIPFTTQSEDPTLKKLIFEVVWIHLIYLSSGIFGTGYPTQYLAVISLLWVVRIALTRQQRMQVILFALLLAIIGGPAEGLVSYLGLFDYKLMQFVRVPWWLFVMYLHGSFVLLLIGRWVSSGRIKTNRNEGRTMAQIKFAPGMDDAALPIMIADIIKGNLVAKPQRQNDFNALNGNIYMQAHDVDVDMTMVFDKGNLTVHSGKVGNPKLSISTDSETLLNLAYIDVKFGLPYYFDKVGLGVVKKILTRELKIKGLLTHTIMLTRFTKLMSVR